MNEWLIPAAILIALCAVVFIQRRVSRLQKELVDASSRLVRLEEEARAMVSGAAGLSDHLAKLQAQLKRVGERQDELEMREPQSQAYEYAITMARRGASREEIIRSCGLVRDEAELLVRMYGIEKAS